MRQDSPRVYILDLGGNSPQLCCFLRLLLRTETCPSCGLSMNQRCQLLLKAGKHRSDVFVPLQLLADILHLVTQCRVLRVDGSVSERRSPLQLLFGNIQ